MPLISTSPLTSNWSQVKILHLDDGAALDADTSGACNSPRDLAARHRDDFLGGAQPAEDFSAHLHAPSGGLHALEGAALVEEDIVVGVEFPVCTPRTTLLPNSM